MGRMYTVTWQAILVAASGDIDWLEVRPADDKPIKLRMIRQGQRSEVGDSNEEGLRISIIRLEATVTPGNGSVLTPEPLDPSDVACGATVLGNSTTVATTSGLTKNLDEIAWNIRNSPVDIWWYDDRMCFKVRQGQALIVRQQTTLIDQMHLCFTALIEED